MQIVSFGGAVPLKPLGEEECAMHVGRVKCAADELSLFGGVWKVTGKSTQANGWLGFSGDEGGNIPPLESCQQVDG